MKGKAYKHVLTVSPNFCSLDLLCVGALIYFFSAQFEAQFKAQFEVQFKAILILFFPFISTTYQIQEIPACLSYLSHL